MKTPKFDSLKPQGSKIRVGLLIWAAILGIIGLLMFILPIAGSASLRGILVFLFLLVGTAMIALSAWLARNPGSTVDDAREQLIHRTKKESAKPSVDSNQQ